MKLSSLLYKLARGSRDVNAIKRGPKAIVKRQVRKTLMKGAAALIGKVVGK